MPEQSAATPKPTARTDLTQGPIARTLFLFSLPVLGSGVMQSLNGSINAVWVGRLLGDKALAATTNATLIFFFLMIVVFGAGMAATILVGQAIGAHDIPRVKRVVGTSAAFFIVTSLALAVGGYAAAPQLLHWMGTPEDVRPLAEPYLRVVFLSMPFLYFLAFLVMAQRGAGDARTPFIFMSLATLLDVTLNPMLITGFGPFPRLGIAGSATSMLVAQAIGTTAMIVYLYWTKSDLRLMHDELHHLKPDLALLKTMIVKGVPMGAQMAVISFSGIMMMTMVNAYGSETAAAYAVATQIWTYLQMPAIAISAGVSAMAAQSIGAKRWDRVEQSARAGLLIQVLQTGVAVILLYLVDPLIVDLFLPGQPAAVASAEHINTIVAWRFMLFGVTFVLFGVVRATGAVVPPLVIFFVSFIVVRIGFSRALEPAWGQDAIWWSFPVSMATSALMAFAYYRWGGWRTAHMGPPMQQVDETPRSTGTAIIQNTGA